MAIIQRQAPTTPNQVASDLVYSVTSNNSTRPQFQFVAKIIDANNGNEVIIKQQPVPAGTIPAAKAVFNIAPIARDFMGEDKIWKTEKLSRNTSANQFNVIFYEETGSSVSSSVSLVNAVSGSSVYLLDGVVEMNSGGWNWDSGSYYTASLAAEDNTFSRQSTLTNSPLTQSVRDGEYATLSVINGNFDDSQLNAQDIYWIQFNVYSESGTNIQNFAYANTLTNGGGPRTLSTQLWSDGGVYNGQSTSERMIHIGVGPKNLEDAGNVLNDNWYSYKVSGFEQGTDGQERSAAVYFEKWFTKQTPECDYEGTRFTWLNEVGGWDYFTFPYANSKSDSIDRKTFKQSFVDYSSATNYVVTYDETRRGSRAYAMHYDETRVAESDWLTTEQADWLRELLESPNVYIQNNGEFYPVMIQTADYAYKTNPRSQKMYRLTISYKLANNRRSR